MVSGIFLALYYVAHAGPCLCKREVHPERGVLGSLVRGMHYWGASFMMVLVALHMLRVFIFGSYKKPRELVWLLGLGLIGIVFGFAFTGYLLPWDQKAYWATVVGTNVAGTVPVVGGLLVKICAAGQNWETLRSAGSLPSIPIFFPGPWRSWQECMLFMLELAGAGGRWDPAKNTPDRTEPLFPHQIFKDSILSSVVFLALAALAVFFPAGLEPQADPTDTTYNPRPEWYFYFVFQLLRIFEGRYEVVGTVVLPTIAGMLLMLLPFLDRSPERSPAKRKVLMAVAAVSVAGVMGLTIMGAMAPVVQAPSVTAPSVLAGASAL